MLVSKQGNVEKEYKTICDFCGCEFKYQVQDITFVQNQVYVQCPTCGLPLAPIPPSQNLATSMAVSPEVMQAILGQGKTQTQGGLMI